MVGIVIHPYRTIAVIGDPTNAEVSNNSFDSWVHAQIPHDRATIGIAFGSDALGIDFLLGEQVAECSALNRIPKVMRGRCRIRQLATVRHAIVNKTIAHLLGLHVPVPHGLWILGVVRALSDS